ncbi:hypothetical protein [Streptomyces sp. SID3343]|uniref:hypothetical protein n=1 Tax=Streptomyces sp. SID3343 TaxID=2690260 RepID=UPI00136A42AA|nr:hypothetical protein [Streptomyces sp. SID3343]MYW03480.1 hypothetical protein [Streptomyces sp. SID3343]
MKTDTATPAEIIAEHWADLRAASMPGTRRPRASHIGRHLAEAIAERDRIERQERSTLGRGASPAAADLSAVQVARVAEQGLLYVEAEVRSGLGLTLYRRATGNPLTVPAACADLARYRTWLGDHANGRELTQWMDRTLRPVARQIITVLGLGDERPLRLLQPCPWCGSPLLVHAAHELGPHVECTGTVKVCEAPATTWIQGRPMWRWDDLAALGRALTHGAPPATRDPLVDAAEVGRRGTGLTQAEQDRLYAELNTG